jgi:signal transduction histidine kinase
MLSEILETARLNYREGRLTKSRFGIAEAVLQAASETGMPASGLIFTGAAEALIDADRPLVKTVFRNILGNSVKHSGAPGGTVTVNIEERTGSIEVVLTDSGIGIPEDELVNIFEPFYRVDKSRARSSGGYGLGMSLCKTIVEAHGGSISVSNSAGGGAAVKIVFPADDSERI